MNILFQKENNFTPSQGNNLGHIANGISKSDYNGLNSPLVHFSHLGWTCVHARLSALSPIFPG